MHRAPARTRRLTRTMHRLAPLLWLALALALPACSPSQKAESATKPPSKSFAADLNAPVTEAKSDSWQPPAKPIDAKAAADIVRAFDSKVVIARVSPTIGSSGTASFFRVNATDGRAFDVDAAGGVVVGVPGRLRWKPVPEGELPLNDAAALQRAAEFVRAVYPAIDDVRSDGVSYGTEGDTLVAKWAQRDGNGALLPKWVRVTVDKKTGTLSDYEARCSNDKTPIAEPGR